MNYLKVLGFQLDVILDCNSKDEYLVDTKELREEMEDVKEIVRQILIIPNKSGMLLTI